MAADAHLLLLSREDPPDEQRGGEEEGDAEEEDEHLGGGEGEGEGQNALCRHTSHPRRCRIIPGMWSSRFEYTASELHEQLERREKSKSKTSNGADSRRCASSSSRRP